MVRNLLLFMFTFCSLYLYAQEKTYKISGNVSEGSPAKYAQLVSLQRKDVTRVPIEQGRFEFILKKDRELDVRALMLTENSLLTFDNYMQEKRSRTNDYKMILVENMEITADKIVADAMVKGSPVNKDLEDMFATINSHKYEQYFAEHPDSPVSLLFLKSLAQIAGGSSGFGYNCKKYFSLLSDRLQQSPEGLALAQNFNMPK